MQRTIIGILGKPLSGKDTVAAALCDQHSGIARISMGDVVREVKVTGPSHRFWDVLHDSIAVADAGGIAPDAPIFHCITELIEEKFAEGNTTVLWVGGPRSDQQVGWLDRWTNEQGYADQFLLIDVPKSEVYMRVNDRVGHNRVDDRTDVIAFRLSEYERVTLPAITRLEAEGRIATIYGVGSKESVAKRAVEALGMTHRDPEITLPSMARR